MGDITKVCANTANQNEILAQNSIIPLIKSEGISKAEVDDASLQTSMDKNKESLKVKLLLRRPLNQLVEQGIMPSLKTSPAFHEQRQKLERAKMGDFLKNKIQRRPDRQELIQQHILEDTTVDPSLQDKQRQLKKARLADGLNDRLSHRPGPLELIKGNILKTDDEFAQAIREGQINFRRTCEGQALKFLSSQLPDDEDSCSEPALSPPQDISDISQSSEPSPGPNQGSPSSFIVSYATSPISSVTSSPVNSLTSSPPPPPPLPPRIFSGVIDPPLLQNSNITTGNSQPKEPNKNRKKSKSKAQPKTRTIKFHEYKGPPNAHKNQTTSPSSETPYELMLQQQQLLLQWQLEWRQKYPQIIMPPAQNPSGDQITNGQPNNIQLTNAQDILRTLSKLEDMKVSDLKAELKRRKLPVSGSKPQLIERLKPYSELPAVVSPPTSGSMTAVSPSLPSTVGSLLFDAYSPVTPRSDTDIPPTSPMTVNDCNPPVVESLSGLNQDQFSDSQLSGSRPSSVVPMDIDSGTNNTDTNSTAPAVALNEDIVKMQQKRIEELQRELEWSQIKLQQQQSILNHQNTQPVSLITAPGTVAVALTPPPAIANCSPPPPPSTPTLQQESSLDNKLFQRQLLHQKLQQHQQSNQQAIPIISPQSTSAAVKASLAAFLHNQQNAAAANNAISTPVSLTSFPATLITSHVLATSPAVTANHITPTTLPVMLAQPTPSLNTGEKPQLTSLSNGIVNHAVVPSNPVLTSRTSSLPNFAMLKATKPTPVRTNTEPKFHVSKAPPNYDEATKQLKSDQHQQFQLGLATQLTKRPRGQKSVKSQAVDDVLEILIKSGELPPSAAQEPPTPTTPDTSKPTTTTGPLFPPAVSMPSATPPPSAILTETESGVSNSLDFDFHLGGLDDIEAMDLGVLDQNDTSTRRMDTSLICHPSQCISQEQNQQTKSSLLSASSNGDLSDFHQHGANMDIELCDWLDYVMPSNNASTALSSSATQLHQPQSSYNCGNENDPLLSHMANTQDAFDLFSIEDMDFKPPSELSVLSWDKVDFAT